MKKYGSEKNSARSAFTLIEAAVVLLIVIILVALLMPITSRPNGHGHMRGRLEASQLANAIHQYHSTYGRFPGSSNALASVDSRCFPPTGEDFTFGNSGHMKKGNSFVVRAPGQYQAVNSEVIAILMDITMFPGGEPTVNAGHARNPQEIRFLEARLVQTTNDAGVSPDLVYRDPWGNPYLISMDLNGDGKCHDAFHRLQAVSQFGKDSVNGHFDLANSTDPNGNGDHFEYNGTVMVWSAGPDGKMDPKAKANEGANKDNVLSWK